jgi:basic membrane protein A
MSHEFTRAPLSRRALCTTVAAFGAVALLAGAALAQDPYRVVYVMSDNLGDKSFNDNAAEGLRRIEAEGGEAKFLQASPADPQLWMQNLQAVSADGGWDIIFTGPGMHDNLAQVAPQYPDQKYVFFDDSLELPNVLSVKYAQNEGSYLAGALAAIVATDKDDFPLITGGKTVGLVAGMDIPVIQDFIAGFKSGVAAIDPSVQVQVAFIGSFSDAQKGYDLSMSVFAGGVDIIYNVAGGAGLGILKAAEDSNRYAIGVDSDQNGLHPEHVVASMVKKIGDSLWDSIETIRAGTAPFGTTVVYGLKNDGVALIYNAALVPDAVQARVDEAKGKVVAGEITVDTVYK